ncbi:hypothetical protein FGIG_08723 [Fasciola gigantica]|uniref:Major facilitator superfamily (MFS) profile domain-containing protein n=1 Tax=Fasciola gigantica TaxID=46835 RepID=A0A504YY53_FASGI|nr:hypothetical protein FGIG_08723 [Fasciola gigantica]
MSLVYVAELFPTEIRSYGFGLVFALSNIGGIICPFVNDLDVNLSHGSPMVIYAAILILVVWSLNLLPDTKGDNICDFLEQQQQRQQEEDEERTRMGRHLAIELTRTANYPMYKTNRMRFIYPATSKQQAKQFGSPDNSDRSRVLCVALLLLVPSCQTFGGISIAISQ